MSDKILRMWKDPKMRAALKKMGVTEKDIEKAEKTIGKKTR
jgi:hypothetical protein